MVFKKENRSRRIFAVMKSVVRFVLFIKFLYTVYAACHILKQEIRKRDSCHGFDDNNRAGTDHRIVATMDDKFCIFPDVVYRVLHLCDRRSRFDCNTKNQFGSVTHSAEHSAGVIRLLGNDAVFGNERVIVLTSRRRCGSKTIAEFQRFDCADGTDGFCQICA